MLPITFCLVTHTNLECASKRMFGGHSTAHAYMRNAHNHQTGRVLPLKFFSLAHCYCLFWSAVLLSLLNLFFVLYSFKFYCFHYLPSYVSLRFSFQRRTSLCLLSLYLTLFQVVLRSNNFFLFFIQRSFIFLLFFVRFP